MKNTILINFGELSGPELENKSVIVLGKLGDYCRAGDIHSLWDNGLIVGTLYII